MKKMSEKIDDPASRAAVPCSISLCLSWRSGNILQTQIQLTVKQFVHSEESHTSRTDHSSCLPDTSPPRSQELESLLQPQELHSLSGAETTSQEKGEENQIDMKNTPSTKQDKEHQVISRLQAEESSQAALEKIVMQMTPQSLARAFWSQALCGGRRIEARWPKDNPPDRESVVKQIGRFVGSLFCASKALQSNVPDQRSCAHDASYVNETRSRGSLHPVC
jgi:hypothetical protein